MRWLNRGGLLAAVFGGWQVNNIVSFYGGTPLSVTASGTSLNAPESDQRADRVRKKVEILGGIGRGHPYFDPFAFAPVTEARFGTAGFNLLRGPGYASWDLGLFRQFRLREKLNLQFRLEAFNVTNTPHFENPGDTSSNNNVSNMQLNPDGSIRNLNGYAEVTRSYGERRCVWGCGWASDTGSASLTQGRAVSPPAGPGARRRRCRPNPRPRSAPRSCRTRRRG